MYHNNMHMLDLVLYGYHGKVDERISLRNVDAGVEDEEATSGKVTAQVSANEPPEDDEDELYDSVDELDNKELRTPRDYDSLITVNQIRRDVVLKLEDGEEGNTEDPALLNARDKNPSEFLLEAEELGDDEIPEVIDEIPISEPDEPVSEDQVSDIEGIRSDDGFAKSTMDTNDKQIKMSPKSSKGRKKSARRGGTRNSNATQMTCEKLQKIKDTVEKAVRERKTFTVQGSFPTIREAMKQRGWVEREMHRYKLNSTDDCTHGTSQYYPSITDLRNTESMLTARLLRNVKVDFLWTMRSEPIDWQEVPKKQMINRFPRAYFTTKVGLCTYLQNMHWFCESGVSHVLFPRCYNVCHPEEMTAFTDDFRLTACLGLLKWLIEKYEKKGEASMKSVEGKIPFTAVEFAIQRCQEYIGVQKHEDIDKFDALSVWDHQWDQFLTSYYMAVHENFLLMDCRRPAIQELYESAKKILNDIKDFWPQLELDGMNNIWIVKPGAKSRGRGIQLTNKLEKVMDKINPAAIKESRYVVQKYIERPLLIYNTKFDIRQWFLVTCAQPLTIWMYKESYLRFCSQSFDLNNLHESLHLCNNAVQCKYKNGQRDPSLPDENMWDCYTFQTYLRSIGHADMWEKCIYPGMRESIICALLASQEHMDRRRNCFELYGADFMLDEGFLPWLIEINSCPCMQPTTSVTARMCSQCLEDVIKVVVDKRFDRRANTGMFELIYKQQIPRAPPYLGMSLSIRGTKISNSAFFRSLIRTRIRNKKQESSDERQSNCSSPEELNYKRKKSAKKKVHRVRSLKQEEVSSESEDNSPDMTKPISIQSTGLSGDLVPVLNGPDKLKVLNCNQSYMKSSLEDVLFFDSEPEPEHTEETNKNISESNSNKIFLKARSQNRSKRVSNLHVVKPPYIRYDKMDEGDGDNSIELESFDSGNVNTEKKDLENDTMDFNSAEQSENQTYIHDTPEIIVEQTANSRNLVDTNNLHVTAKNETPISEIKFINNEFRQINEDLETSPKFNSSTNDEIEGKGILKTDLKYGSEIQDVPKFLNSLEKNVNSLRSSSAEVPSATITTRDEKITGNRGRSQEKESSLFSTGNRDKFHDRSTAAKNKSGKEDFQKNLSVIDKIGNRDSSIEKMSDTLKKYKRDSSSEKGETGNSLLTSAILKISRQSLILPQDKKSRESSCDRETASSGPEINIPKKKKIVKVKTLKIRSMESESFSSDPEQKSVIKNIKMKKQRNALKEQELMKNRSEYNSRKQAWNRLCVEQKSGSTLTNKVKKTDDSSQIPPPSNRALERTLEMSNKNVVKIVRDSSEERNFFAITTGFKKVCKRNARKKKSVVSFGKNKYGSTETKLYARRRNSNKSSEEHEPISSSSENTIQNKKCCTQTKTLENSEVTTEEEIVHSTLKNLENNNSKNENNYKYMGVKEDVHVKNNITELKQSSYNSKPDDIVKKTAQCIKPIMVDLIEDLAHQMKKSQKEESKCDETFVEKDKMNLNNKCLIEPDGKLGQTHKKNNPTYSQDDVITEQEKTIAGKLGGKQVSMIIRGEADNKGKSSVKMWSYPKDGLNGSNLNAEEAMPKCRKPQCKQWKNGDDAEKSMEFFNEWRQKLDRTKASCEDMLAKLKLVRDNECSINKPKYFSIDRGINWEGENKPTISDIIKKLSQTQPEREFFMCERYIDTLPIYTFSDSRDKLKRKPCDLTIIMEDNINFMTKHSQRLCTESHDQKLSTSPRAEKNSPSGVIRGILPHIKQRMKLEPSTNLYCNGRRVDNFFALGMSLKTLQINQNQKQQLLVPLSSDHCQGVSSTTERASCN